MSFDVMLYNSIMCPHCNKLMPTDDLCHVDPHVEGGTYVRYGSIEASLNVTYNYSKYYYMALDMSSGLGWLHLQPAGETIEALADAVATLGVDRDSDYWKATPGNAGHALSVLLEWARKHPNGVWWVV